MVAGSRKIFSRGVEKNMATKSVSVNLQPEILDALAERGQRAPTINRDLERLYTLYERALRRVSLTVDEACLIVDALNSSLYDARTAGLLPAGIQDAIQLEGLAEKWNVDGDALVKKLSSLDELACLAIIDAAERFWFGEKYRKENMDIREAVKEIFGVK